MSDQSFWETQWKNGKTGWDIGFPSPAIAKYILDYPNKDAAILIPGCGNAYEAQFLLENDFTNITLIDIAPKAVEILKEKFKNNPGINILNADFFQHEGKYDLMIEQTFFCAINPIQRDEYAKKAAELLNEKGKIIGLLFNRVFEQPGPPFGGFEEEYQRVFEHYFLIKKMTLCYNSILPRKDKELFIHLVKK